MDAQNTRFREKYITGPEVNHMVGVTTTALRYRIKTGFLPEPIKLTVNLLVWERTPELMTLLESWSLTKRQDV